MVGQGEVLVAALAGAAAMGLALVGLARLRERRSARGRRGHRLLYTLTREQARLVSAVSTADRSEVADLAAITGLAPTALHDALLVLARAGWVTMSGEDSDRTGATICLTPEAARELALAAEGLGARALQERNVVGAAVSAPHVAGGIEKTFNMIPHR